MFWLQPSFVWSMRHGVHVVPASVASQPDNSNYFCGVERFRQHIVCAEIQGFGPQACVCQPGCHDQEWGIGKERDVLQHLSPATYHIGRILLALVALAKRRMTCGARNQGAIGVREQAPVGFMEDALQRSAVSIIWADGQNSEAPGCGGLVSRGFR